MSFVVISWPENGGELRPHSRGHLATPISTSCRGYLWPGPLPFGRKSRPSSQGGGGSIDVKRKRSTSKINPFSVTNLRATSNSCKHSLEGKWKGYPRRREKSYMAKDSTAGACHQLQHNPNNPRTNPCSQHGISSMEVIHLAKVLGPLHSSEARGRVGGLIYNTWRGIATVKAKVAPSQPMSELQLQIRSRAVYLAREWAELTQEQRNSWNDYALSHQDTDWTGNPKRISGFNWYLRCNMAILAMGGTIITTAPATSAPDAPTTFETTFATPSIDISWDAYAGTDTSMDLWLVGPGSGGSQLPIEDGRHNQYALGESAAAEIAPLVPGFYRVFARAVDETTGLTSPWVSDICEVTA